LDFVNNQSYPINDMMLKTPLFRHLFITFFLMVIAGTMIHEAGHYTMAKALGYKARITYRSMVPEQKAAIKRLYDTIYTMKSPDKQEFEKIKSALNHHTNESIRILVAGPSTNMLLGTIGFVLLFVLAGTKHFSKFRWMLVFTSLLWSRQVLNFMVFTAKWILQPSEVVKPISDEVKLSYYAHLPYYTFSVITCVIALPILLITIFKFIRRDEWPAFFAAGILGGGSGVLVWFFWIGPIILP
jgi:hypothetical protein